MRLAAVEVWVVDSSTAERLIAAEGALPRLPEEQVRAIGRMADAEQARLRLAAHVALRMLVERHAGTSFRGVSYARTAAGKPSLPGCTLELSLTHTAGLAAAAVCDGGPIGLDVERVRPMRIAGERRQRIEAVAADIGAGPLAAPAGTDARFVEAWTRLEALAKATGEGIGPLLERVVRGGAAATDQTSPLLPGGTRVVALAVPDGWYGALTLPAGAQLRCDGPRVGPDGLLDGSLSGFP